MRSPGIGLLGSAVAVDEDNGRVFGVGRAYNPDLDLSGSLHVRAFDESGDSLWSFQEHGRNPSLVNKNMVSLFLLLLLLSSLVVVVMVVLVVVAVVFFVR